MLCTMPRIHITEPEDAEGRLREIYQEIAGSRGKIASVHKIQSLHPETIPQHMNLYMGIMFSKSPLSRAERELMAVVVSVANGCKYCQKHHIEALLHFWKDQERAEALLRNYAEVDLSERERALCDYAWDITVDPAGASTKDPTHRLRNAKLNDRAILDATLVVGYFNFVNRIVQALDVDLEENPGGYRYE
jgi:uncharacterized peroxidase-related enzyme